MASSWTTTNDVNTADRHCMGFGTQNAGVKCGGQSNQTTTEEYNGSTWASGNAMTGNRTRHMAAGTLSAGLAACGSGSGAGSSSEEYDGTNWSSGNSTNVAHTSTSTGGGVQTDALIAGGTTDTNSTESYDGTNWSNETDLNVTRCLSVSMGSGQTDYTTATGMDGTESDANIVATSSEYNGTTWSAGGTLTTGRSYPGGTGGAGDSGYVVGGRGNGVPATDSTFNTTEEYNGTSWSSGGVPNNAAYGTGNCGTLSAGLKFAGNNSTSDIAKTEEYDAPAAAGVSRAFMLLGVGQ